MNLRRFLPSLIVALAAILAAPRPALADRIVYRDGRVDEGRVVAETADEIELEFRKGSIIGVKKIKRSEIKEIIKEASVAERYDKEIAAAKSADALVDVAKRALAESPPFDKAAKKALEQAVKLDPEHAAARELLKHKKVDGKWLSEREWKLKEGWKEDPRTRELVSPEDWKKRESAAADKKRADAEKATKGYEEELKGTGEWFVIETKNYLIRCNSTQAVAKRYADFMEKIYTEYDKVFKKYKRHWSGKSTIYIFRSNEEFKIFAEEDRGIGGFYRPKSENPNAYPDRIVAAFHGAFGTGDTREVLAHECTHQMQHILCDGDERSFMVRPPWWMEGYACYFGDGFRFDKKGNLEIVIPRMRLNSIQTYLKNDGFLKEWPMSKFVRLHLMQYQMMAGLTYPYGWSLVYYFKERGRVPVKGKKGQFEQKPVKIMVDGKEREVNLSKVLDDYFAVITKAPPGEAMSNPPEYYAKKLDELLGFPVDALMDDWKKFVLELEGPSLGKLDKAKKKFTSPEGGFEIDSPGLKGWKWNEEDCEGDEAIRLENAESSGLVIVEVDGNMENTPLTNDEGGSECLKDNIAAGFERFYENCAREVDEKTAVAGLDSAWHFTYTGSQRAMRPGQKVRSGEQKVWHIIIGGATLKRTYQVICVSDKDKFDENKAAFDKIVQSFKLLKEN